MDTKTNTAIYLAIRHGSNSANQPMLQSQPLFLVEATDEDHAKELIAKVATVYANQWIEILSGDDSKDEDWTAAQDSVFSENNGVLSEDNVSEIVEKLRCY